MKDVNKFLSENSSALNMNILLGEFVVLWNLIQHVEFLSIYVCSVHLKIMVMITHFFTIIKLIIIILYYTELSLPRKTQFFEETSKSSFYYMKMKWGFLF